MKKILLACTMSFMFSSDSIAQKWAHNTTFCGFDKVVSLTDLQNCHALLTDNGEHSITSFVITLHCVGVLKEYAVQGNAITEEILLEINKSKPITIYIEQVMVTKEGIQEVSSPVTIAMTY